MQKPLVCILMAFCDFIIKPVKGFLSFRNFVKRMSFYHSHKINIGVDSLIKKRQNETYVFIWCIL